MRQIHRDSREYVKVTFDSTVVLGTQPVAIAFTTTKVIAPGDWMTAQWVDDGPDARVLIGPGGAGATLLTPGVYYVHGRVTDNPEIPVIPAGKVNIY